MALWHQKVVPNTPLTSNIGFPAAGVIVDNYTAYWLYFPDADAYVPPFYAGVALVLVNTTDYARFYIQSPFSGTQAPTETSYFVHTIWTNDVISASPGSLLNDVITGSVPAVNVTITTGISLGFFSNRNGGTFFPITDPGGGVVSVLTQLAYETLTDPSGSYGSGGHGLTDGKLVAPANGTYRCWGIIDFDPNASPVAEARMNVQILINGVSFNPYLIYFKNRPVTAPAAPLESNLFYAILNNISAGDLINLRAGLSVGAAAPQTWNIYGQQFGLEWMG